MSPADKAACADGASEIVAVIAGNAAVLQDEHQAEMLRCLISQLCGLLAARTSPIEALAFAETELRPGLQLLSDCFGATGGRTVQ